MDILILFLEGFAELLPCIAVGWFIVEFILMFQRKSYMKGYRKSGKSGYKSKNKIRLIISVLSIVAAIALHHLIYMIIGYIS